MPKTTPQPINRKVTAQAAGTGLGGVLAIIIAANAERAGISMSPEEAIAYGTILSTVLGLIAGQLKHDRTYELGIAAQEGDLVPADDVAAVVDETGETVAGEALPPEGQPVDVTPTGGSTSTGWSTALPPEGAVTGPPDKEA